MMNKLSLIVREKCPHCKKGNAFNKRKSILEIIPKMKANCEICGYHYEREPGFYQGAMFVSYGLSLIEGFVVFFILLFLNLNLNIYTDLSIILGVIFLLSIRNFKLSRMIWLYLLPK